MTTPDTGVPAQIAGYRILEEIARGGMGSVCRAYQVSMDRTVAVKLLAPKYTDDAVFTERFLKEARAAARLNHPNIVQAIDVGQADGRYYFVMEFVEGKTLTALLRERSKLPPLEACGLIVQIARALEHAARFQMLHLDVKPGNIMVTSAGLAKLADFGLARHVEDEDTIYTQKKVIFGTPHYMSPEQIRGGDLDSRSDLYSLGVAFYEIVTGQNPFAAPTTPEVLQRVKAGAAPPNQADPSIPADVSDVIAKMMASDREERYRDPTELLLDLDALMRLKPPPVVRHLALPAPETPRGKPPPWKRWAAVMGLGAAALAAILLGAALAGYVQEHARRSTHAPPTRPVSGTTLPAPPTTVAGVPPVAADPQRDLFRTAVSEAERLMSQGSFKEALKVYEDFASKNAGTSWAEEAVRAATGVHSRAGWRAEEIARDVNAAVDKGDFATADSLCNQIAAIQLPEAERVAQQARERVKRAADAAARLADEARRRAVAAALAAIERNLPLLLREERFAEALAQCSAFMSNPDYAEARPQVRPEQERLIVLKRTQAALISGAAQSAERPLQPQPPRPGWAGIPTGAVLLGARDQKALIRAGAAERAVNLRELADADLEALMRKAGEESAAYQAGLAAFLEAVGRYRDAVRHLGEMQDRRPGRFPDWLGRVEYSSLLGAAAEELDAGFPRRALDDLRNLKTQYGRSRFYQNRRPEIGVLLARVRARLLDDTVPIPDGSFIFQQNKTMYLPLFHIDVHEVTNAKYARFLDYLQRTQDPSFDHPFQPPEKKGHVPLAWEETAKNRPNHPVVGVDWYDAYAYANWAGKRLPTEMEWEKAARGTDGRRYPWGNTWEDGRCNAPPAIASTAADLPKSVAPAGSFPSGNSPYGVTDLAGNAREWINDEAAAASDAMATHGGSFLDPTAACVVTYRLRMPPLTRDMGSGFRCAADPVNDAP